MLTEYIRAAMHQASYELLPEGEGYYGEIAALPGVWADGRTRSEAKEQLRQVLKGWIELQTERGQPLPNVKGVRPPQFSLA